MTVATKDAIPVFCFGNFEWDVIQWTSVNCNDAISTNDDIRSGHCLRGKTLSYEASSLIDHARFTPTNMIIIIIYIWASVTIIMIWHHFVRHHSSLWNEFKFFNKVTFSKILPCHQRRSTGRVFTRSGTISPLYKSLGESQFLGVLRPLILPPPDPIYSV